MFIACSFAKIRLVDFVRGIPLFAVALVLVLLLITYYPPLVLFLPNLVVGSGFLLSRYRYLPAAEGKQNQEKYDLNKFLQPVH